ncbi:MAG: PEP-CTERM sorting domain-containing protein [Vicinamibacterales bacterium]
MACVATIAGAPLNDAWADPVAIASIQSAPGVPTFYLNLADNSFGSINTLNGLPAGDPFNPAAPISFTQLTPGPIGPIPAFFLLTPLALTGAVDPNTFTYGAGAFAMGLDSGSGSLPWLGGTFDSAFLFLSGSLDGALANFGGTTLVGGGLTFSGTSNPGSFAFALGNPQFVMNDAGAPAFITFEMTQGTIAATVPEPASTFLLLGSVFGGVAAFRRLRPRA